MSDDILAKIDALKKQCIPKEGFNLIGIDTFAIPGSGEEVYVVGHYSTIQEVQAAQQQSQAANPHELYFVYGSGPGGAIPEQVQKSELRKFYDFTAPIVQADNKAYEQVKRVLVNKYDYKAEDFEENGKLYGWSVNELLDLLLEDKRKS